LSENNRPPEDFSSLPEIVSAVAATAQNFGRLTAETLQPLAESMQSFGEALRPVAETLHTLTESLHTLTESLRPVAEAFWIASEPLARAMLAVAKASRGAENLPDTPLEERFQELGYPFPLNRFLAHRVLEIHVQELHDEFLASKELASVLRGVKQDKKSLALSRVAERILQARETYSERVINPLLRSPEAGIDPDRFWSVVAGASKRNPEACHEFVAMAPVLRKALPDPRGRKRSHAAYVYEIVSAFWGDRVYTYDDTANDGAGDFTDPVTLAVRKITGSPRFNPTRVARRTRARRLCN
jgi:hypothetical protein